MDDKSRPHLKVLRGEGVGYGFIAYPLTSQKKLIGVFISQSHIKNNVCDSIPQYIIGG
jgi:hypothetical protein